MKEEEEEELQQRQQQQQQEAEGSAPIGQSRPRFRTSTPRTQQALITGEGGQDGKRSLQTCEARRYGQGD